MTSNLTAADLPHFRDTVITSSLKMGYQLAVADLNRDGTPNPRSATSIRVPA